MQIILQERFSQRKHDTPVKFARNIKLLKCILDNLTMINDYSEKAYKTPSFLYTVDKDGVKEILAFNSLEISEKSFSDISVKTIMLNKTRNISTTLMP